MSQAYDAWLERIKVLKHNSGFSNHRQENGKIKKEFITEKKN